MGPTAWVGASHVTMSCVLCSSSACEMQFWQKKNQKNIHQSEEKKPVKCCPWRYSSCRLWECLWRKPLCLAPRTFLALFELVLSVLWGGPSEPKHNFQTDKSTNIFSANNALKQTDSVCWSSLGHWIDLVESDTLWLCYVSVLRVRRRREELPPHPCTCCDTWVPELRKEGWWRPRHIPQCPQLQSFSVPWWGSLQNPWCLWQPALLQVGKPWAISIQKNCVHFWWLSKKLLDTLVLKHNTSFFNSQNVLFGSRKKTKIIREQEPRGHKLSKEKPETSVRSLPSESMQTPCGYLRDQPSR